MTKELEALAKNVTVGFFTFLALLAGIYVYCRIVLSLWRRALRKNRGPQDPLPGELEKPRRRNVRPYHRCPIHGYEKCFAYTDYGVQETHYCSRGERISWLGTVYRVPLQRER